MNTPSSAREELVHLLKALEPNERERCAREAAALRQSLRRQQQDCDDWRRTLTEAQTEIAAGHERFAQLYDFAPVAFLNFDAAGVIRSANVAATSFFGTEHALLVGHALAEFLKPEDAAAFHQHLRDCAAGEGCREIEVSLCRIRTGWTPVRLKTVFNDRLTAPGSVFMSALDDLTERRRVERLQQSYARDLEQQVGERTAALREANADLELFSTTVSHDLRAPLRMIRLCAGVLLERANRPQSADDAAELRQINTCADRLDHLLSDLLEFSRVRRERLVLVRVELRKLIEEVVALQRAVAPADRFEVSIEGPPADVRGHPAMLRQVLGNLVENARKFVSRGVTPQIVVSIEPRGHVTRVAVHDNGIGVEPGFHEQIFLLFERLHSGVYPGTGAGLAIAKSAITRMGGRMGVESAPGRGSTFWFELATATPARAEPDSPRERTEDDGLLWRQKPLAATAER